MTTTTRKYEITSETHPHNPALHRIRALRDIPRWEVKAGDLGGWIEKETSLNQSGDAWVYGDAWVSGNAWVYGDARVYGGARVSGDAQVSGNAWVSDNAQVTSLDHLLTATVMASTLWPATLTPTSGGGHRLRVGCWTGTVAQFRAMAESDQWVEADPETIMLRRPELLAFAAMCEARIAMWTDPKEDQ